MVDCFHTAVFLAQNSVKAGVGVTGLFRGKACCEKSGVQFCLILPVFPSGFGKVEKAFGQPHQSGSGSSNGSTDGSRHSFYHRACLFQPVGGFIGGIGGAFHFITEAVHLLSGILKFFPGGVNGRLIVPEFPFHLV